MKIFDFLKTHKTAVNIILIIGLILLAMHIYSLLTSLYITIQFRELRPIHEKVFVFYKGLKIGQVTKMELCHDCKSTMVKVRLSYKGLKLPINTTALLKKEKKKKREFDFIELVYPKEPSQYLLADGNIIDGKATTDIETFFANQDPDSLEHIKQNLESSSENLDNAMAALGDLFVLLQDILKENQKNLYQSSGNLARTTENINLLTGKFNSAIKQQNLDKSISNLDESTANFTVITGNLSGTTGGLNQTMPRIDSALYQTQGILCNLNEITCGIKNTMKKPFGGLRVLFGKSIDKKKNGCCSP